ncbi:UvrD-helicase domain-containing protein [Streptomyces sp. NPDC020883]|uniref:UvrD-helicase domain-containing protein n=1 Tax=Streptomyces sp. NPDC020883 TaxID=3365099 RepID=UPI00379B1C0F
MSNDHETAPAHLPNHAPPPPAGRAAEIPADATPVEGAPGYRFTRGEGTLTVYGPDGTVIGTATETTRGRVVGTVDGVRIPGGEWRNTVFPYLAARQHQAASLPEEQRDRVWIELTEGGGSIVHGADKDNSSDYEACQRQGNFYWKLSIKRYGSGSQWKPATADRNLTAVLMAFAAQGRHVVVRSVEQTKEAKAPGALMLDALNQELAELVRTINAWELRYGGGDIPPRISLAMARRSLLRTERADRFIRDLSQRPAPDEVPETQELLAERDRLQRQKTSYTDSDAGPAIETRLKALDGEIRHRTAQEIASRPDPSTQEQVDISHEQAQLVTLRKDYEEGSDDWRIVDERIRAIGAAWSAKELPRLLALKHPAGLNDIVLFRERRKLRERSSKIEAITKEYSQAMQERLEALRAEAERRDEPENRAAIDRVTIEDGKLYIDGQFYGEFRFNETEEIWQSWYSPGGNRPQIRTHGRSRAALIGYKVKHFDEDEEMEGARTWGPYIYLDIPKAFSTAYVEFAAEQGHRRPSATCEAHHIAELISFMALHHHREAKMRLPSGLLAELERQTHAMVDALRAVNLDRAVDKRDRARAGRQIKATAPILLEIEKQRSAARAKGWDDDRKVVSAEQLAQQLAGLADASAGEEDDDGSVRAPGLGALGTGAPEGTGTVEGSAEVLHGSGDVGPDPDRGTDGGVPGGDGGHGRLPAAHRPAQRSTGQGGGSGPARTPLRTAPHDGVELPRFVYGNQEDLGPDDPVAKAQANCDAIALKMELETSGRALTQADRQRMVQFRGWGSVPLVFAPRPKDTDPAFGPGGEREGHFEDALKQWTRFASVRDKLGELLSPTQWRAAASSTVSAYYTPPEIARAMWSGLQAFGITGGEGLDGGSGMAIFGGTAPEGMRLTCVESEVTTAELSRMVFPHLTVLNESFADTDIPAGTFDFGIGNPPFANIPVADRVKNRDGHLLHNYFLIKQLELLRPGGYGIWITSTGTLDSRQSRAREEMARHADLIGAYRLPARVFSRSAGTDVVVDVLVFRRRMPGEEPRDQSWLKAQPYRVGNSTPDLNCYFHQHPEHVLGTLAMRQTQRGPELTVKGSSQIAARLEAELCRLGAKAVSDGLAYQPHPEGPNRPALRFQEARIKHAQDFSGRLYIDDNGIVWQHNNGLAPIEAIPADGETQQLRHLITLRDLALELRALDASPDADRDAADQVRAQLKTAHRTYTQRWGPLSRPGQHLSRTGRPPDQGDETPQPQPTAWGWFVMDPQSASVLGLERWDKKTQTPVLASILDARTDAREVVIEHTDDPKTALAAVHGRTGRVDLDQIARMLGVDTVTARAALVGRDVFEDPESETGELIPAWLYLSGAVRDKLHAAKKMARRNPAFQVNVTALEGAMPPLRKIGEFRAKLGAAWIPEELVQSYLRHRLGDPTLVVVHTHAGWTVKAHAVLDAANTLHGTRRRRAVDVAMRALNGGSTQLMTEEVLHLSGGRTRTIRIVDEDATREYRQKIDAMRAGFETWILDDKDRLTTLTDAYNTQMNGHVLTRWEGMQPPTAGMTKDRTLGDHQNAAAARMLHSKSVIIGHEMGLGKTTTAIVGAMALKQAGRIQRPFVVAPKKALDVWEREARFLYPNARTLVIRSQDLAGLKRRPLLEYLRTDGHLYDLVIWQEEAFQSVPMSPEWQEWYEEEEVRLLKQQITTEKGRRGVDLRQKVLEERIERRRQEIRRAQAPARRPGEIYLNDLALDYAIVDEAHRYKGLAIKSGLLHNAPEDSLRGIHLHQFTTWLHSIRKGLPALALLTGTPLTNTIADMYNLLRLADEDVLKAFGVLVFDDWGMTYGELVARVEQAPDGSGIKLVERFSKFDDDLQSLLTMWLTVADVMLAEDAGIERPAIKGGKPSLVIAEDTPQQKEYGTELIARGIDIHNGDARRAWLEALAAWEDAGRPGGKDAAPRPDIMLSVTSDGRKIAMDPRLFRADAQPGSKITKTAQLAAKLYEQTKNNRYAYSKADRRPHPRPGGLIPIFCDLGTPGTKRGSKSTGFIVYDALKAELIRLGVPADKIAYIHDAGDDPEAFAELTARAWDGRINVLIGSSQKMGESLNFQNRVTDIIHMDPTFTPHLLDQRNGRGIRQGNQNPEVGIHYIGTRHTLDSWEYGILTSKVASSRVVMSRTVHQAMLLEIDEIEADFGTMQAELTGNPYLKQLFTTREELSALASNQRITAGQRLDKRNLLAKKQHDATRIRAALPLRGAALPRIRPTTGDNFLLTVAGTTCDRYTQGARTLHSAIIQALTAHASAGRSAPTVEGHFGGLDLAIETHTTSGELTAHLHFPDLPGSRIELTPQDLQQDATGESLIRDLRSALEAAPKLQEAESAQLPDLEYEIDQLEKARDSDVDHETLIERALGRIAHLESIVAAQAELDKLPPPGQGTSQEQEAERRIRQDAIGQAVERLEEYDRTAATVDALTRPIQQAIEAGAEIDETTLDTWDQLAGQIESGRSNDPTDDLAHFAEQLEGAAKAAERKAPEGAAQDAALHLRKAADLARDRARQSLAPLHPAQAPQEPNPASDPGTRHQSTNLGAAGAPGRTTEKGNEERTDAGESKGTTHGSDQPPKSREHDTTVPEAGITPHTQTDDEDPEFAAWMAEMVPADPAIRAPVQTRAERSQWELDRVEAKYAVPRLGWSEKIAEVAGWAAEGRLTVTAKGIVKLDDRHRVAAGRVQLLAGGGFVQLPAKEQHGSVVATADGKRAARLATVYPEGLHADDKAAEQARFKMIANGPGRVPKQTARDDSKHLPPLSGGEAESAMHKRRVREHEEWVAQAPARQAHLDAITAEGERRDREREEARQRRIEEREAARRAREEQARERRMAQWASHEGDDEGEEERETVSGGTRRVKVQRIMSEMWHATTRGQVFYVPKESTGWVVVAPDDTRIGSPRLDADGEPDEESIRELVRAHLDGEPAPAVVESAPDPDHPARAEAEVGAVTETAVLHGGGAQAAADSPSAEPRAGAGDVVRSEGVHSGPVDASPDGPPEGVMAGDVDRYAPVGGVPPEGNYVSRPASRATALDLNQRVWAVECDRHGPETVLVDMLGDPTQRKDRAGIYESREDAQLAAQLHLEEHQRRDAAVMTPEEIEEATALALSKGQDDILDWAADGKLYEFVTGFWGEDVSLTRDDVNKKAAKGRVLTFWAADYLAVLGVEPGVRRLVLTDKGRAARRLWNRARRIKAVEFAAADNGFGVSAAQRSRYPLLSEDRLFKGETPGPNAAERKAAKEAEEAEAARIAAERETLPPVAMDLMAAAEAAGWSVRTQVRDRHAVILGTRERDGGTVRAIWEHKGADGWVFMVGGAASDHAKINDIRDLDQVRQCFFDADALAAVKVTDVISAPGVGVWGDEGGYCPGVQAPRPTEVPAVAEDEPAAGIEITHTPAEGKRVHGTERGDKTGEILRSQGTTPGPGLRSASREHDVTVAELGTTPPSQREDHELEDEESALHDILQALEGATDPLDLAYRLRAEHRAWEIADEKRRREPIAAGRDRGQIILDRLLGYGLNEDAPALSSGDLDQARDQLPPAKPGAPSDDEWARIEAQAAAGETYPATPEQQLAVEAVARRRLNVAIRALAGTGKSATIQKISRRLPGLKIAYLAFNRSVVDEAKQAKAEGKYGENVEPMTANGLAFQAISPRYADAGRSLKKRLDADRQTAQQVADLMRVYEDLYVGYHRLRPPYAADLARTMLRRWCQSADAELGPQHVKVPTSMGEANRQALFTTLKPLVDRMWADITDPYGTLTYDHEYIVKQWALSGFKIPYDIVAWDEAQDVNPVLDGALRAALKQGVQVVAVGDANQSIYSFRGATDALSHFPVDVQLTLTQSFRFGDAIADAGNRFLRLLGTRMRLKGLPDKPAERAELGPDDVDAILTRTNATAVTEALSALDRGKRVAVAGGLDEIRKFIAAVEQLRQTGKSDHKDLAAFSSWDEVLDYVESESEAAGSMRTLVQLIENDKEGRLSQLLTSQGLTDIRLNDDGNRIWVSGTQWGNPDHKDFTDWLKNPKDNGFGKLVYDGASGRWYYQPGRHQASFEKNGRTITYWVNNPANSLADARRAIEAHLTALTPQPDPGQGCIVSEDQSPDITISTAHKSKGLEWPRVRIAADFLQPKLDEAGHIKWDTIPDDEDLRLSYVAVTRATAALDIGSLGWVWEAASDQDPQQHPTGIYRKAWAIADFAATMAVTYEDEDGSVRQGTVVATEPPGLMIHDTDTRHSAYISLEQVLLRDGQPRPQLDVATDTQLDQALADGHYRPPHLRPPADPPTSTSAPIPPQPRPDAPSHTEPEGQHSAEDTPATEPTPPSHPPADTPQDAPGTDTQADTPARRHTALPDTLIALYDRALQSTDPAETALRSAAASGDEPYAAAFDRWFTPRQPAGEPCHDAERETLRTAIALAVRPTPTRGFPDRPTARVATVMLADRVSRWIEKAHSHLATRHRTFKAFANAWQSADVERDRGPLVRATRHTETLLKWIKRQHPHASADLHTELTTLHSQAAHLVERWAQPFEEPRLSDDLLAAAKAAEPYGDRQTPFTTIAQRLIPDRNELLDSLQQLRIAILSRFPADDPLLLEADVFAASLSTYNTPWYEVVIADQARLLARRVADRDPALHDAAEQVTTATRTYTTRLQATATKGVARGDLLHDLARHHRAADPAPAAAPEPSPPALVLRHTPANIPLTSIDNLPDEVADLATAAGFQRAIARSAGTYELPDHWSTALRGRRAQQLTLALRRAGHTVTLIDEHPPPSAVSTPAFTGPEDYAQATHTVAAAVIAWSHSHLTNHGSPEQLRDDDDWSSIEHAAWSAARHTLTQLTTQAPNADKGTAPSGVWRELLSAAEALDTWNRLSDASMASAALIEAIDLYLARLDATPDLAPLTTTEPSTALAQLLAGEKARALLERPTPQQRRAQALARATTGEPDNTGRRPVRVDGELTGHHLVQDLRGLVLHHDSGAISDPYDSEEDALHEAVRAADLSRPAATDASTDDGSDPEAAPRTQEPARAGAADVPRWADGAPEMAMPANAEPLRRHPDYRQHTDPDTGTIAVFAGQEFIGRTEPFTNRKAQTRYRNYLGDDQLFNGKSLNDAVDRIATAHAALTGPLPERDRPETVWIEHHDQATRIHGAPKEDLEIWAALQLSGTFRYQRKGDRKTLQYWEIAATQSIEERTEAVERLLALMATRGRTLVVDDGAGHADTRSSADAAEASPSPTEPATAIDTADWPEGAEPVPGHPGFWLWWEPANEWDPHADYPDLTRYVRIGHGSTTIAHATSPRSQGKKWTLTIGSDHPTGSTSIETTAQDAIRHWQLLHAPATHATPARDAMWVEHNQTTTIVHGFTDGDEQAWAALRLADFGRINKTDTIGLRRVRGKEMHFSTRCGKTSELVGALARVGRIIEVHPSTAARQAAVDQPEPEHLTAHDHRQLSEVSNGTAQKRWSPADVHPGDEILGGFYSYWHRVERADAAGLVTTDGSTITWPQVRALRRDGQITRVDTLAPTHYARPLTTRINDLDDDTIAAELDNLTRPVARPDLAPIITARRNALQTETEQRRQRATAAESQRAVLAKALEFPDTLEKAGARPIRDEDGTLLGAVISQGRNCQFINRDGYLRGFPQDTPDLAQDALFDELEQLEAAAPNGWRPAPFTTLTPGESIRLPDTERRWGSRHITMKSNSASEPFIYTGATRTPTGQITVTGHRDGQQVHHTLTADAAALGALRPADGPHAYTDEHRVLRAARTKLRDALADAAPIPLAGHKAWKQQVRATAAHILRRPVTPTQLAERLPQLTHAVNAFAAKYVREDSADIAQRLTTLADAATTLAATLRNTPADHLENPAARGQRTTAHQQLLTGQTPQAHTADPAQGERRPTPDTEPTHYAAPHDAPSPASPALTGPASPHEDSHSPSLVSTPLHPLPNTAEDSAAASEQTEKEHVAKGAAPAVDADELAVNAGGAALAAGKEAQEHLSAIRKLADSAESYEQEAEEWDTAVGDAVTVAQAEHAADEAHYAAEQIGQTAIRKRQGEKGRPATGMVKEATKILSKIKTARKTIESASSTAAGDTRMQAVCDQWLRLTVEAEQEARECLKRVQTASDSAHEAAQAAIESVHTCPKCELLLTGKDQWARCGCGALIAATLADLGRYVADPEAVAVGRLLASDSEELHEAGQLALAGLWQASADLVASAQRAAPMAGEDAPEPPQQERAARAAAATAQTAASGGDGGSGQNAVAASTEGSADPIEVVPEPVKPQHRLLEAAEGPQQTDTSPAKQSLQAGSALATDAATANTPQTPEPRLEPAPAFTDIAAARQHLSSLNDDHHVRFALKALDMDKAQLTADGNFIIAKSTSTSRMDGISKKGSWYVLHARTAVVMGGYDGDTKAGALTYAKLLKEAKGLEGDPIRWGDLTTRKAVDAARSEVGEAMEGLLNQENDQQAEADDRKWAGERSAPHAFAHRSDMVAHWRAGGRYPDEYANTGAFMHFWSSEAERQILHLSADGQFTLMAFRTGWEVYPAGDAIAWGKETLKFNSRTKAQAFATHLAAIRRADGTPLNWANPDIREEVADFVSNEGESLGVAVLHAYANTYADGKGIPQGVNPAAMYQRAADAAANNGAGKGRKFAEDITPGDLLHGELPRQVIDVEDTAQGKRIWTCDGDVDDFALKVSLPLFDKDPAAARAADGFDGTAATRVYTAELKPGDVVEFEAFEEKISRLANLDELRYWSGQGTWRVVGIVSATVGTPGTHDTGEGLALDEVRVWQRGWTQDGSGWEEHTPGANDLYLDRYTAPDIVTRLDAHDDETWTQQRTRAHTQSSTPDTTPIPTSPTPEEPSNRQAPHATGDQPTPDAGPTRDSDTQPAAPVHPPGPVPVRPAATQQQSGDQTAAVPRTEPTSPVTEEPLDAAAVAPPHHASAAQPGKPAPNWLQMLPEAYGHDSRRTAPDYPPVVPVQGQTELPPTATEAATHQADTGADMGGKPPELTPAEEAQLGRGEPATEDNGREDEYDGYHKRGCSQLDEWVVIEADPDTREMDTYLSCSCGRVKLCIAGRKPVLRGQIDTVPVDQALALADHNSCDVTGPWQTIGQWAKRAPVTWRHATPEGAATQKVQEPQAPADEPGQDNVGDRQRPHNSPADIAKQPDQPRGQPDQGTARGQAGDAIEPAAHGAAGTPKDTPAVARSQRQPQALYSTDHTEAPPAPNSEADPHTSPRTSEQSPPDQHQPQQEGPQTREPLISADGRFQRVPTPGAASYEIFRRHDDGNLSALCRADEVSPGQWQLEGDPTVTEPTWEALATAHENNQHARALLGPDFSTLTLHTTTSTDPAQAAQQLKAELQRLLDAPEPLPGPRLLCQLGDHPVYFAALDHPKLGIRVVDLAFDSRRPPIARVTHDVLRTQSAPELLSALARLAPDTAAVTKADPVAVRQAAERLMAAQQSRRAPHPTKPSTATRRTDGRPEGTAQVHTLAASTAGAGVGMSQ